MPLHDMSFDEVAAATGMAASRVSIVAAHTIIPERVTWLWDGWLAAGKLHVLAGAPGTGKTTIGMALAATISTGGRWPDGSRAPIGDVLVWSGEDDPADTLVPRLIAMGADMTRIHFISGMVEGEDTRAFNPATDTRALADALAQYPNARLLHVDPIVSAVAGDSHKNAEVRQALQPLVDLGHQARCAVLGISHFSKGTAGRDPTERVTGSIAFGALARIVLATAKIDEQDGEQRRVIARAKSNIGLDSGGFYYDLEQVELDAYPGLWSSRVLWGEAIAGEARDILAESEATNQDATGAVADAKAYLQGLLQNGPVAVKTIREDSRDAGHSWRTVERAKTALSVAAVKAGMSGGWVWQLTEQRSPPTPMTQKNVAVFDPFGGLPENQTVAQDENQAALPKAANNPEDRQPPRCHEAGGLRASETAKTLAHDMREAEL